MNKYVYFVLCIPLFTLCINSNHGVDGKQNNCLEESDSLSFPQSRLIRTVKNNNYGYVDANDKVFIPCKYSYYKNPFEGSNGIENGVAVLQKKNEKWAIVDTTGKELLVAEDIIRKNFSVYAVQNSEGFWGITTVSRKSNGKCRVNKRINYQFVTCPSEYVDGISITAIGGEQALRHVADQVECCINIQGDILCTADNGIWLFDNGVYGLQDSERGVGFTRFQRLRGGKMKMIGPVFGDYLPIGSNKISVQSDRLFVGKTNGTWACLDYNLNEVFVSKRQLLFYDDGLYFATDGYWTNYFLNENDEIVITLRTKPCKLEGNKHYWNNGLCFVTDLDDEKPIGIINKRGDRVYPPDFDILGYYQGGIYLKRNDGKIAIYSSSMDKVLLDWGDYETICPLDIDLGVWMLGGFAVTYKNDNEFIYTVPYKNGIVAKKYISLSEVFNEGRKRYKGFRVYKPYTPISYCIDECDNKVTKYGFTYACKDQAGGYYSLCHNDLVSRILDKEGLKQIYPFEATFTSFPDEYGLAQVTFNNYYDYTGVLNTKTGLLIHTTSHQYPTRIEPFIGGRAKIIEMDEVGYEYEIDTLGNRFDDEVLLAEVKQKRDDLRKKKEYEGRSKRIMTNPGGYISTTNWKTETNSEIHILTFKSDSKNSGSWSSLFITGGRFYEDSGSFSIADNTITLKSSDKYSSRLFIKEEQLVDIDGRSYFRDYNSLSFYYQLFSIK